MAGTTLLEAAQSAHQSGDTRQALVLLRRFLTTQPGHPQANLQYGLLLANEGRLDDALTILQPLSEKHPDVPAVAINLGEVLRRLGRFDEAVVALQRAVRLAPDFPVARFNLALALRGADRLDEALEEYAQALRQKPDHGDGWYNQGNAQLDAGLYEAAEESYRRALTLLPAARQPRVLNNLGSALVLQRRPGLAEVPLEQAVILSPDYADAELNLAVARERLGYLEQAAEGYRRAAMMRPEHWWHALRADCVVPDVFTDNAAIDRWRTGLANTIDRWREHPGQLDPAWLHVSGVEPPSTLMYQGRNDRALKSAYADMLAPRLPAFEPPRTRPTIDRPRIGLVVSHGHEIIFARSIRGILEQLDLKRYEIVVAVTRPGFNNLQRHLPIAGLNWLALSQRVDQAAEQLRNAHLDLLYHWEVGSDSFNYFLPWFRVAPVQYTGWGWPTTSGIPGMDYFLSSDLVEPDNPQRHYRETLLCMPDNMFTWAEPPERPANPPGRTGFGFAEQDHLYLCHQNPRKLHPDFDTLAAGILERDPAGRLLLIGSEEGAETAPLLERLRHRLGPLADRVQVLPRMTRERYLGLLCCVDVTLDPPHYSGANTSFDAIGLGVPLITQSSALHRGNFTVGLYHRMGLTGLIAHDEHHYIDLAVSLTSDKTLREYWHRELLTHSPAIFHDARAVTELERAWQMMLEGDR